MKKLWSIVLAAVMILSLAACGGSGGDSGGSGSSGGGSGTSSSSGGGSGSGGSGSGGSESSGYQDTLTVVLTNDAGTLSPFELNSANMKKMARPILETLTAYDSNGELQMLLLDHYEYNEDSTGVTLYLKQGIKFHNGEEFTAEDVKYTFEGYYNGNTKSDVSKIDVENVEIINDYTLFVPAANGLPNATMIDYFKNIQIVNKDYMESGADTSTFMIGTGPYKLVEYVTGDHLTYELFDDYWGGYGPDSAGYGRNHTLIHRFISEAATAMIELEGGNVDIVTDPLTADIERVDNGQTEGIKAIDGPLLNLYFVAFNNGAGICSDIRVRQAIAYATNKEDIRIAAFNDYSKVANSPVPMASVGYDAKYDSDPYAFNVDRAKELLAEAGVAEGTEITLLVDGGAFYAAIADQMIYQLNNVGLKVNMIQYDTATVNDMIFNTNDWNMVLRNYTSIGEPQASLDLYGQAGLSGLGGSVCTRLEDDPKAWELTDLLNSVASKSDYDERCAVYSEIQDMWSENLWTLPLICRTAVGLANDRVECAYVLGSAVYNQYAYVTN